ncbi:GumC domain-containing protein [Metabacillus halosaccharovorans]|uniref:hypothetical protein n=1 Tax=Metabacillus halosaccharovorans TaxID=930124 RepID=UPI003735D6C8
MSDIKAFLKRVGTRMMRFWLVLIIVPILTATVSYFANQGSEPVDPKNSMVKAYVEIDLGNFDSIKYNTSTAAVNYIKSTNFINKVIKEKNLDVDLVDLKQNMIVSPSGDNALVISYTSMGAENTEMILNSISDTFYQESSEQYTKKLELVKSSSEKLRNQDVATEEVVEKEEFLYDLQEKELYWEEPIVSQVFSLDELSNKVATQNSPIYYVIFGLLVGIILSLIGVLSPELFRDVSFRKGDKYDSK